MGLAKGRGFSAKQSGGHFRVGRVPSAGNRPFQKSAISLWKVGSFVARNLLLVENFTRNLHLVNFTRNLLLAVLLSVLRMF